MNDILLNIVNIRMAIMICIGVILVREIYLVLNRNKAANLDDIRHMAFTDIDMAAVTMKNH